MSQILSEEQLFGRIYYYLSQLEIWKVKYPILETFREELPPNIPLFSLSVQGGYKKHFRDVVFYLDTYVKNNKLIAEEYMANIVYTIFDQLDIALSKKGDSELLLLFEKRFYVNCQRHWKNPNNPEDDPNPISSSKKSFETIGLCDFDESCKLVNVTKTTNRDVLTKKTELRVGLFSLTENFQIIWGYTKILNANRNTHGFVSLGIENDQYKEDLKKVLDTIKEKKLNVVCFPELMISDREQSYFCDILENQYLKNADQSAVVPFFLLICGSFHKKTTLNYKGQVPIIMYINGKAMPLSYYFKHEPFIIKFHSFLSPEDRKVKKIRNFMNLPDMTDARERTFLNEYAMEDIERDRGITIIEIENFGKFGVAVCKDVLPMGSIILERYGYLIDHLFILSLNFSDQADFALIASQLAKKKKISVAYVNAKGYDRSNKSPSFYLQMPDPSNDQPRRKQSLTSDNAPKKPAIIIYQDANKDSIFFRIPRKKNPRRGR